MTYVSTVSFGIAIDEMPCIFLFSLLPRSKTLYNWLSCSCCCFSSSSSSSLSAVLSGMSVKLPFLAEIGFQFVDYINKQNIKREIIKYFFRIHFYQRFYNCTIQQFMNLKAIFNNRCCII